MMKTNPKLYLLCLKFIARQTTIIPFTPFQLGGKGGGGSGHAMVFGNCQCRGVLMICIKIGQGPTVLAVGVVKYVWIFFL